MRPGLSRISKVRKDHVRLDLECIYQGQKQGLSSEDVNVVEQ